MTRRNGTALFALVPYFCWVFVSLDLVAPVATADARALLLGLTIGVCIIAFTYPGWADQ